MVSLSTFCDLTKAYFDQIMGDPTSPTVDQTIAGHLIALQAMSTTEGSDLMDGTEETIYSVDPDSLDSHEEPTEIEGYIDLNPMVSGDTIIIREYIQVQDGSYRQYASHTYTNAQSDPALHAVRKAAARGYKITAEQSAGTYRTLYYYFARRRIK